MDFSKDAAVAAGILVCISLFVQFALYGQKGLLRRCEEGPGIQEFRARTWVHSTICPEMPVMRVPRRSTRST